MFCIRENNAVQNTELSKQIKLFLSLKNTDACIYLHIEWKWHTLMQVWRDGCEGELTKLP